MNNFVTGLVRRGAGLPTPVMIRPAGLRNVPASAEAVETSPDVAPAGPITHSERVVAVGSATPDYAKPDAPTEQPAGAVRPRDALSPTQSRENFRVEVERVPITAAQSITRQAEAREEVAPARGSDDKIELAPQPSPMPRTAPALRAPLLEVAATSRLFQPGDKSAGAVEKSKRKQEVHEETESSTEPLPVRVIPRREPLAEPRPAARTSAAAPTAERGAAEQRSIHVKIGRVEIRSAQPAPPARGRLRRAELGAHISRSGWMVGKEA